MVKIHITRRINILPTLRIGEWVEIIKRGDSNEKYICVVAQIESTTAQFINISSKDATVFRPDRFKIAYKGSNSKRGMILPYELEIFLDKYGYIIRKVKVKIKIDINTSA